MTGSAMHDMRGKVVLVTGATDGIGRQTATSLASAGARVIVTGRDRQRGQACVEEISATCANDDVEALYADLSTLAGIRDLAAQVLERHERLDVLINNAGLAAPQRRLTVDGLESDFAVNVVAPHLLSTLLAGPLSAAAAGRIVTLAGGEHPKRLSLEDLQSEKSFTGLVTYSRAKLLMMALMYERAQRSSGSSVTCNVCYPGQASTSMTRSVTPEMMPGPLRFAFPLFRLLVRPDGGKSAAKASRSSVYLASSPELDGVTGAYFDTKCKRVDWPAAIMDDRLRTELWDTVEAITAG